MSKKFKTTLFHFLSFYVLWFFCLISAAKGKPWVGVLAGMIIISTQILWQIRIAKDTRSLGRLMVTLTLSGIVVDSILLSQNVLTYSHNIFAPYFPPPWIIIQWVEFAIIIHALLQNYWQKTILLAILSLVGFTAAYLAGENLGAATLNYGFYSAFIIGIIWAILLPVITLNHSKKVANS